MNVPHSFDMTLELIVRFTQQPGLASIAASLAPERLDRVRLSLQILCEQLQRLFARLIEFDEAAKIIQQISDEQRAFAERELRGEPVEVPATPPPLHAAQFNVVNRIEAFHQHVYVCISVLGAVLELLAPHGWMRGARRGSVSGLLKFLEERLEGDEHVRALAHLTRSVHFRSKLIEHCQSHALQSWMTYREPNGELYLVYFVPSKTMPNYEADFDPDPYSTGFRPPTPHASFYVAPSCVETFAALDQTILFALGELGLANQGAKESTAE